MKKIFNIIFMLFISLNFFSQKVKKDLYLFITERPVYEISNDTIIFQKFKIDFENKSSIKNIILIDDKGYLIKKISLKGTSNKVLNLIYKNVNLSNNPIIVSEKDIINYLTFDEIIYECDFENFKTILKNFNVYLINSKKNSENYYIAKKILIENSIGL